MRADDTIGVFDSGVGGISVLHEVRALLPSESIFYVADSGHCPYGGQTEDYIRERSLRITEWLIARGAKCIVVACNTATAAAAGILRATFTCRSSRWSQRSSLRSSRRIGRYRRTGDGRDVAQRASHLPDRALWARRPGINAAVSWSGRVYRGR